MADLEMKISSPDLSRVILSLYMYRFELHYEVFLISYQGYYRLIIFRHVVDNYQPLDRQPSTTWLMIVNIIIHIDKNLFTLRTAFNGITDTPVQVLGFPETGCTDTERAEYIIRHIEFSAYYLV